jgi:hypothetical protein
MAFPGTQLRAQAIFVACCKRDTTVSCWTRARNPAGLPTPRTGSDSRCFRAQPSLLVWQPGLYDLIKSRSSRAEAGLRTEPAAEGDVRRTAAGMLSTLPRCLPLDARLLRGQRMTDVDGKCGCTVRIVLKLRPDQYDELARHVREIGSTLSAFLRESAAKAMNEGLPHPARTPSKTNE